MGWKDGVVESVVGIIVSLSRGLHISLYISKKSQNVASWIHPIRDLFQLRPSLRFPRHLEIIPGETLYQSHFASLSREL